MYALKPFDIVLGLKVGLNERLARQTEQLYPSPNRENSVSDLAASVYKGRADISRSLSRLQHLGLIGERQPNQEDVTASNRRFYSLNRNAMSDLLIHGVKHIFAPEKLGLGRGMPTGWNCPHVRSEMNPPEIPIAWPSSEGSVQGELIEPLYPQCVLASLQDNDLYVLLALIDVVRLGKPRELKYAHDIIRGIVSELHS